MMRLPTLREYNILQTLSDTPEFYDTVRIFTDSEEKAELKRFAMWFVSALNQERESNENLRFPYCPDYQEEKRTFVCNSTCVKIVSDYTNMGFNDVFDLEIFIYWSWLHDAVVWNLNASENGRKQLEKSYLIMQDKPDMDALRALQSEMR